MRRQPSFRTQILLCLTLLSAMGIGGALAGEGPASASRWGSPVVALASGTVGETALVEPTLTAPSSFDLTIQGDVNLGRFVFKGSTPFLHNEGTGNTALGLNALSSLTLAAGFNDSTWNTAVGLEALKATTTGGANTAVGFRALPQNMTGFRNIALGQGAGLYTTTGSDNIFIGSYSVSPGTESNTLRIGTGTGTGNHQLDKAYVAGISGVTLAYIEPRVCIDDQTDQLGKCGVPGVLSSIRFKEDVRDVSAGSDRLLELRPVEFRYKKEFAHEAGRPIQYGLIAEEVAEIFPELVAYDDEGRPAAVRYKLLSSLLLAELQKQASLNAEQARKLAELEDVEARLARLEALLLQGGR